jgi:hypothetical protein
MQYAHYMSKTYLKAVRTNSSDIEADYNKMISDNDLNQVRLHSLTHSLTHSYSLTHSLAYLLTRFLC